MTPMLVTLVKDGNTEAITLHTLVMLEIAAVGFRVIREYMFLAVLAEAVALWRLNETSANLGEKF